MAEDTQLPAPLDTPRLAVPGDENLEPDSDAVASAVAKAVGEDLGTRGDVTSSLIPAHLTIKANFVARQPGVLAGTACGTEAFRRVEEIFTRVGLEHFPVDIEWYHRDGDLVDAKTILGQVSGTLRTVLVAERTALNFLCHLSGVASATRRLVDIVKAVAPECNLRDTRKTTPGLRALEKAAVRAGGGQNHRMNLSEGILVKDNHLTGISIADAVAQARKLWPEIPLEVECDDEGQVTQSVDQRVPMVLLDNMTPDQVAYCVGIAHQAGVKVEVSGGINATNITQYAMTGADYISVGSITHSAQILDIGLDVTN